MLGFEGKWAIHPAQIAPAKFIYDKPRGTTTTEVAIRSSLVVAGDADATAARILQSPGLYRAGFALDAVMLLSDVALAVVLFHLLRPVSSTLSLMAAAFRLAQAAVLGFNLLNYHAPMLLLGDGGAVSGLSAAEVNALVLLFLELHAHGYDLGLIFFGASNLVLGHLVVRATYLPSVLGYGLQAAGVVYLAGSFTRFVLPVFHGVVEPAYVVPLVAELSFCLWLLVKGVRDDNRPSPHSLDTGR